MATSSDRRRAGGAAPIGVAIGIAIGVAITPIDARADARTPLPWDDLAEHAGAAFGGENVAALATAVGLTAGMSFGGGDYAAREFVQTHLRSRGFGNVAYYAGYTLPVVVPAAIYVGGLLGHAPRTARAGAAAIQSLALVMATTTFLKVATGRPFPNRGLDPDDPGRLLHREYALTYRPFYLHGDLAWPSGHTAAGTSIAAALAGYYAGDALWIDVVAYAVAGSIAVGMLVGDMHWTSDVLAGGLMAHTMGWSIGRAFRHADDRGPAVRVVGMAGGDVTGIALIGAL